MTPNESQIRNCGGKEIFRFPFATHHSEIFGFACHSFLSVRDVFFFSLKAKS